MKKLVLIVLMINIVDKKNEFNISENSRCWALSLKKFALNYEGEYIERKVNDIENNEFIGLQVKA